MTTKTAALTLHFRNCSFSTERSWLGKSPETTVTTKVKLNSHFYQLKYILTLFLIKFVF